MFLFISLSLSSFTTWFFSHGLPRGFTCGPLLHGKPHGRPCGGFLVYPQCTVTASDREAAAGGVAAG